MESVLSSGIAKTIASRFFFSPTVQREFNDSAGFERLASPSRNHRFNGTDFVQVQVETDLWNRPRLVISPSNCENRDRIGFPLLFLSIFLSFSFAKLASILRPRSAGPILFTQFPIPKSRSLSLSRPCCCFFIRGIFTLYYVLPRVKASTMVHYTRLVYRNRSLVRWAYIRRRRSSRLTRNVGPATYNASDLFNNDDR